MRQCDSAVPLGWVDDASDQRLVRRAMRAISNTTAVATTISMTMTLTLGASIPMPSSAARWQARRHARPSDTDPAPGTPFRRRGPASRHRVPAQIL